MYDQGAIKSEGCLLSVLVLLVLVLVLVLLMFCVNRGLQI